VPPVVGVFDSGFGGLTVLRELLKELPAADYLYFGDTARLPYGSKSSSTVARYAISAAQFLAQHNIEILVIACNTATALAFHEIRAALTIPVIGVVEPGAEKVAAVTRSKQAAVIATEATIASHAYRRALNRFGVQTTEKACPLLVPLIEEGWIEHPVTEQVAHVYMDELFKQGSQKPDALLLGCTHYPLIRSLLRRVVPAEVQIVDSAESTAARVAAELGAKSGNPGTGSVRCYATDSTEKFRRLGSRFLGRAIDNVELVDLEK